MNRFLIGLGVLALLLAAAVLAGVFTDDAVEPMALLLDNAGEEALQGRWSPARDCFREARSQWLRRRRALAALSDHAPLEQADSLFHQLGLCLLIRDETTFSLLSAQLSETLRTLRDLHSPTWETIL